MVRILTGLGFKSTTAVEKFTVEVPSWRIDVEQEEDLVEEVARHTGYDKIASELPPSSVSGEYQPSEMKQRSLRRALNAFGFDEAINFSFIDRKTFELIPQWRQATTAARRTRSSKSAPGCADASAGLVELLAAQSQSRHSRRSFVRNWACFRHFAAGELPQEPLALGVIAPARARREQGAGRTRTRLLRSQRALGSGVDWMNLEPCLSRQRQQASARGTSCAIKRATDVEIGRSAGCGELSRRLQVSSTGLCDGTRSRSLVSGPATLIQYSPLPRIRR
jgi:phenylalanyl-tRNA synthetase beta chain